MCIRDRVGGDLWHLSEIDCTSPTHCWYLGDEDTERYNNNMNNSLVSPEIKLGLNPLLTFIANVSREQYEAVRQFLVYGSEKK